MRLKGKLKVVEEIEQRIINNANCLRYKPNVLDDVKSGLCTRQYMIDTKPSLATVKLILDYRDNSGEVHIKDDKIWKLAHALPNLIELMCRLEPYYRHRWISQDELAKLWAERNNKEANGKKKEVKSGA